MRAPCSHQMGRCDAVSASEYNIESTGVTPTPAEIRITGCGLSSRKKLPPRRRHLDEVAGLHVIVNVSADGAHRLPLDGDAVLGGTRLVGQRVIADERRSVGVNGQPQHDRLTGKPFRQRCTGGGVGERHRTDLVALVMHRGHRKRAEARPRRWWREPGQPAVTGSRVLLQQTLQRGLPSWTQRRDGSGAFQRVAGDVREGRAGRRSRRR